MTKLVLIFTLLFSSLVFAEDLSKDQLLSTLQQLKSSGMIPADKAPEVEKLIKDMSPDQLAKVQGVARGVAAKSPEAKSDSVEDAAHSVDTDSEEFIEGEEEVKKILK